MGPPTEPRQVALVRALLARTAPAWTVVPAEDLRRTRNRSSRRLEAANTAKAEVRRLRRRLSDAQVAAGLTPGAHKRLLTTVARTRARASMVDAILAGKDLDEALAEAARSMLDAGETYSALLNLAGAAEGLPTRRGAPHLVAALAASHSHKPRVRKVVSEAAQAEPVLVRRWAAPHVVRAALAQSQHDVVGEVLVHASDIPTDDLASVAQLLLRHEAWTHLHVAVEALGSRRLSTAQTAILGESQAWLTLSRRPSTGVANEHIPVLSVLAPDSPATNGADLAGRLVAFAVVDALAREFAPHLRVHPVPRSRPSAAPPPAGGWSLVTGSWQRTHATRAETPIAFDGQRALVVGWRPSNTAAVSDEVLDALRLAAPVGCADWSGVDLLLGAGVPAFFSGPVSGMGIHDDASTAGSTARGSSLAARPWPGAGELSARVDAALLTLSGPEPRTGGTTTDDVEVAAFLASRGRHVVPAPPTPGAPTWDGLLDVADDPDSHRDRGRRLAHELRAALRLVVRGAPPEEVRSFWRDTWRREVDQARDRQADPTSSIEPLFDLRSCVAQISGGRVDLGPGPERENEVHVAMASDTRLADQVPVALEGLTGHTQRPLTVWFLHRGFKQDYMAWLSAAFPAVRFRFLPCETVAYPEANLYRHISQSTMDRLLLPEIACDIDMVVYLDIDALVCGDVGELADLDLGELPLAARPAPTHVSASMRSAAFSSSSRLPMEQASELRRAVLGRHPRDAPGFNAGVLLLNLHQLRRQQFCDHYLGWVARYRLHDQSLLLFFAGAERLDLPARWNMWPAKEKIDDPGVVHWIGPRKPWSARHVPDAHRWLETQQHLEDRLGMSIASARVQAQARSSQHVARTTGA